MIALKVTLVLTFIPSITHISNKEFQTLPCYAQPSLILLCIVHFSEKDICLKKRLLKKKGFSFEKYLKLSITEGG